MKRTQIILQSVRSGIAELFLDSNNIAYARLKSSLITKGILSGNNFKLVMGVRTAGFESYIWTVGRKKNLETSQQLINQVVTQIELEAVALGKRYELHLRSYKDKNVLWYDLGGWRAVKITKDGWEVVPYPPPMFFPGTFVEDIEEREPERSLNEMDEANYLENFLGLWAIDYDEKILLKLYIIISLIPGFSHPILVLHGPYDSGKSTLLKYLKRIIDPTGAELLPPTLSQDIFLHNLSCNYCICLDNLNYIPTWLADDLCCVCTGGYMIRRKLFTDNQSYRYSMQKIAMLSCINFLTVRPDFLSRCIMLHLQPIIPANRLAEVAIENSFRKIQPKILGEIFTMLAKAFKIIDSQGQDNILNKLNNKGSSSRLVDFALWAEVLAQILGLPPEYISKILLEKAIATEMISIENNPLVIALEALLTVLFQKTGKSSITDMPANIYNMLRSTASQLKICTTVIAWPSDPGWLVRRLKELAPVLARINIFIQHTRTPNARLLTIYKKEKESFETQKK